METFNERIFLVSWKAVSVIAHGKNIGVLVNGPLIDTQWSVGVLRTYNQLAFAAHWPLQQSIDSNCSISNVPAIRFPFKL